MQLKADTQLKQMQQTTGPKRLESNAIVAAADDATKKQMRREMTMMQQQKPMQPEAKSRQMMQQQNGCSGLNAVATNDQQQTDEPGNVPAAAAADATIKPIQRKQMQ
jgi:hypothetical protein